MENKKQTLNAEQFRAVMELIGVNPSDIVELLNKAVGTGLSVEEIEIPTPNMVFMDIRVVFSEYTKLPRLYGSRNVIHPKLEFFE